MWSIIMINEKGNETIIEQFTDDNEAVLKYKQLVENRHSPGGFGYITIYLSWIEF